MKLIQLLSSKHKTIRRIASWFTLSALLVSLLPTTSSLIDASASADPDAARINVEVYVDTNGDGKLDPSQDKPYTASNFTVPLKVDRQNESGSIIGSTTLTVSDNSTGSIDGRATIAIPDQYHAVSVKYNPNSIALATGYSDITGQCPGAPFGSCVTGALVYRNGEATLRLLVKENAPPASQEPEPAPAPKPEQPVTQTATTASATTTATTTFDVEVWIDENNNNKIDPSTDSLYKATDFTVPLIIEKQDEGGNILDRQTVQVKDSSNGSINGRGTVTVSGEYHAVHGYYQHHTVQVGSGYVDVTDKCPGPPFEPSGCVESALLFNGNAATLKLLVQKPAPQEPSLSISKTPSNQTKEVGQNINSWTITVTNSGQGNAQNVQMVDNVPSQVTNLAVASNNGFDNCSFSGQSLTCSKATLASNASASVTISGRASTATGSNGVNNVASYTATGGLSGSATANIRINQTPPDITYPKLTTVSKTVTPANPSAVNPQRQANGTANYTITLRADSSGNTAIPAGVVVSDVFGIPSNGGTLTNISNVSGANYNGNNNNHTFTTTSSIAPGATRTITFRGTFSNNGIPNDSHSTIANTARIQSVPSGTFDNVTRTATVRILGPETPKVPELSIEKKVRATGGDWVESVEVTEGDAVYFRLQARNTGNETATGVRIDDAVPAQIEVTHQDNPNCDRNGNNIECTSISLAPNAVMTIVVSGKAITPTGDAGVRNIVTLTHNDKIIEDDATVIVRPMPPAQVGIKKFVRLEGGNWQKSVDAKPGDKVQYSYVVYNEGVDSVVPQQVSINDSFTHAAQHISPNADRSFSLTKTLTGNASCEGTISGPGNGQYNANCAEAIMGNTVHTIIVPPSQSEASVVIENTVSVQYQDQTAIDRAYVNAQYNRVPLKGYVWHDENDDRLINLTPDAEEGIDSVTVNLYDADDANNILASVSTDSNGYYYISSADVVAGLDYRLEVVNPNTERYSHTGLNLNGRVGSLPGTPCTVGPKCESNDTFSLMPLTTSDSADYHNFGLRRKTGSLQVRLHEVSPDGSVLGLFDQDEYGDVEIQVRGEDANQSIFSDVYTGDSNRNYATVPTGTYFGNILQKPHGWSLSRVNGCTDMATVSEGETGYIDLCLQGSASIQLAKYVRAEGDTQWSSLKDMGIITGNAKVQYMIVAWNNGSAGQRVDILDETFSSKDQIFFTALTGQRDRLDVQIPGGDGVPVAENIACNPTGGDTVTEGNYIAYCYENTLKDQSDVPYDKEHIVNQVKIFREGERNTPLDSDLATVIVSYLPELEGSKSFVINPNDNPRFVGPALPGDRVQYTLTVTNEGNTTTNFNFRDDISGVLPFVNNLSASHNGQVDAGTGMLSWGVVTVEPGQSVTRTFVVTVKTSDNWPEDAEPTLINSFFDDTIEIPLEDPYVDLIITKDDSRTHLKAGESTTYEIVIGNAGNSTAEGVYLLDTLPTNMKAGSLIVSTLVVEQGGNTIGEYEADTSIPGTVRWPKENNTFSMPAGATGRVTVTLIGVVAEETVNPYELMNRVEIRHDSPRDVNPDNNTAVDIDTLTVPDIRITKGVGYTRNGSFGPSATISTGYDAWYRIVVSNHGTAAETVSVTDEMNFDRFSAVYFNDIPVEGSGDTEFTLAEDITLAPDESRTFKVRVVAGGTAENSGVETVVNTAEVTFGEMSKTDQAALNIHAEADVVLEKRAWNITPGRESDPTVVPVQSGDWIEYTLTARNVGSAPTPAFTFVDNLSDVLDDVNLPWTADENLQFPQGGMLLSDLSVLNDPDSPITSTVFPVIGDNAGGPGVVYESTQSIDPNETLSYKFRVRVGDLEKGNNILRNVYGNPVVIHVTEPALHITKEVDYSHRYPGEMVWFTLTVENRGNETANNIEVIDYLPHDAGSPHFKYAGETRGATNRHPSGPGGSALIPGDTIQLHWNTNTHGQPFSLAPGQKLTLSYKALVDVLPPDFEAAAYINEAEAHFDGGISNRAQVQVLVHPFPASPLIIDKTFDGMSSKYREVGGGERTNFVVRVHNTSNTDNINGIYVSDLLPQGFTVEKDVFGQIVKATVSIRDGAGNTYNNPNPLAPCRFGSCQLTPSYVPGDGKFVWPAGNTGFTVPKGGTLTINFNESLRAPMVNTLTPFVNQATLLRDGDPIGSDSVFGLILPPPAPDVRIDKQVKLGKRTSGSAYQESLTIDSIIPEETWVTYRITAFNTGTLGQTVRLTDTVDFASADSVYDELRVYKEGENTPVATYNTNTHGALTSITLAEQFNVTAGSSLDNACQGCRYFIEARIRSAFAEGDESHRNVASVVDVNTDSLIAEDDATVKVDVRGALEIAKRVRNFSQNPGGNFGSQATAEPGDIVEYRIDLQNTGVVSLQNVTVEDQLDLGPQGFPYHSNIHLFNANADNNTRSFSGPWDMATISEVAPGTTESFIIRAVIASPFVSPSGTEIHNVACVADNCAPPTTVIVDTVGRPNIAKLVSKDGENFSQTLTAQPGETLTYKVMVWNSGDGLIPSLTVSDVLDTQDYASYGNNLNRDADNNSNLYSGTSYESLSISVPGNTSMTSAEVFTFTATLKSAGHFSDGDITINTASFTYNDEEYEDSTRVTINVPAPKLELSKSAENLTQGGDAESKTAKPGDEIRYTLRASNTGNAATDSFTFEDDISDVLEYADVTDADGGNVSGGVISWPAISSIAAGATQTHTFTVKIKDPLPTTGDFVMMNVFGNEVQVPVGDLKLSKKATFEDGTTVNRAVRSGETIHYCIAATNLGSQSISNYVFQDGVEGIAEYAEDFRKVAASDPNFQELDQDNDGVTDLLRWDPASIGAGATVSRCFAVTVKPTTQWPEDGDFQMDNVYGDRVVIDVFHAGIEVVKDLVTDPVTAIGQNVRFRMTVTNDGQVPLFSFRMEDLYDTDKLDFVSVSQITAPNTVTENAGSQSSRVINGLTIDPAGQLSWDWSQIESDLPNSADDPRTAASDSIPSLNPGESFTFFADFVATAVGHGHNELYVWADDFLPYSIVEDGDDAKVEVRGADVSLTKTANPTQIDGSGSSAERTVTYTLTLRNTSNQSASNLRLEDLLPAGFAYTGTATLDGVANAPTQTNAGTQTQLNWSGINLGANQTVVVSYQAIAVSQAGNYINLAVLKDAEGKTLDTAQATVTVTVPDQENPLRVDKSVDRSTVKVGEEVVYTVKVTNAGDTNLTSVSLSDALPAGFVYQGGATLGGQVNEPTYNASANPQVLNWTGLSLDAGQTATVVYRVKAAMTAGIYTNLATAQVGNFSASDAVNVNVVVPQVLGVKSGPTKGQPFVSVLSGTGSDLSVVFGSLFLVLMSFGGFQLIARRKKSAL